ncbi:MAG: LexA family protein [Pseudomonadota bacterium]
MSNVEPSNVVRLPVPVAAIANRSSVRVPLVSSTVAAGFPSPADDYLDRPLDFNELLIENPAATFAVRVAGESMTGAGIFPGDIAIVDRSKTAASGAIVLALVDGEFTIKRYRKRGGRVVLQAENSKYKDIVIPEDATFEVWGVVTKAIRML